MLRKLFVSCLLLVGAITVVAQNAPPAGSNPNAGARPMRSGNAAALCFQKAGLDQSVMQELFSIQREARSQIQNVCSNTSLTPEQKHQQVEEIHQQTHAKIGGLITPEQQQELIACRQQQQGGASHPGGRLGMGGGCGEGGQGGMRRGGPNSGIQGSGGSSNPVPSTQLSSQD